MEEQQQIEMYPCGLEFEQKKQILDAETEAIRIKVSGRDERSVLEMFKVALLIKKEALDKK